MTYKCKSKRRFPLILLCLSVLFLSDITRSYAFEFKEVAEKYKQSIVKVYTASNQGTGFFVSETGHIVTCLNLINEIDKVQIKTSDGKAYVAYKILEKPDINIAIIKIDGIQNPCIVEMGDSSNLKLGSWVLCGGFLNKSGVSYNAGIILTQSSYFFQTDAAAPIEYNGGPVFDQTGKVIGVIGAGYENKNGIRCGIAIPINLIMPVIEQSKE